MTKQDAMKWVNIFRGEKYKSIDFDLESNSQYFLVPLCTFTKDEVADIIQALYCEGVDFSNE